MPAKRVVDSVDTAMQVALETASQEELRAYFDERAREYARASWAKSTLKQYDSQFRLFSSWCQRMGHPALPTTAQALTQFIVYESERLTSRGERRKTAGIRQALAAIRFMHTMRGHVAPLAHPVVQAVWRGHKRVVGSVPVDKAEAVTIADMLLMLAPLDFSDGECVRDRALMAVGFAAALRPSEIRALTWRDVTVYDEGLFVVIRDGKNRPGGYDGVMAPAAQRHQLLCPVAALRAWSALLARAGFTDWKAPVFQRIGRDGAIAGELAEDMVGKILQRRAQAVGLSTEYTGHSLRNGWATWAAERGKSLFLMQLHMRHVDIKTTSTYVQAKQWAEHPGAGLY